MHISAVEEYGLRCALQLASLEGATVLAASQIAEREGISVQYASKIMHLFRKAGLVSANRGMQGGFRLSQPADQISLKSVFRAIREEEAMGFCDNYKGLQQECVHMKECSVRPVWKVLSSYFDSVLDNLSLADLNRPEADSRRRIEVFARGEADRIRERFSSGAAPGVAEGAPLITVAEETREAELEGQFDLDAAGSPQSLEARTNSSGRQELDGLARTDGAEKFQRTAGSEQGLGY
ncbi:MAG: Rrf2 family transcriptional regulator [Proteobacteria bacterium]|nr:MAG: Rrf2 family transcriptional regulator [Pseudomonadota bacterium]